MNEELSPELPPYEEPAAYTSVTEPVWANAEQTMIDALVQFTWLDEPVRFSAAPSDAMAYGRAIYADCVDGHHGPVAAYVAPVYSAEQLTLAARAKRDSLLAEANLRIAPLQDAADLGIATEAEASALLLWKQYRVELSRIEQQAGFPGSVVWPAVPVQA